MGWTLIGYTTQRKEDKQMKTETKLPERINAMKLISYDVRQIVEMLMAENELENDSTITLEMVMDRVQDWVEEDFAHDVSDNTIYQDENGAEL
jgi:hypothetical protein